MIATWVNQPAMRGGGSPPSSIVAVTSKNVSATTFNVTSLSSSSSPVDVTTKTGL